MDIDELPREPGTVAPRGHRGATGQGRCALGVAAPVRRLQHGRPSCCPGRERTPMDAHKLVKMANEIASFFEAEPDRVVVLEASPATSSGSGTPHAPRAPALAGRAPRRGPQGQRARRDRRPPRQAARRRVTRGPRGILPP